MEPSEQRREPSSMGEDAPSQQVRSSYHAPLLRSHGALNEATSGTPKSTDTTFKSDVHAKENIMAVGFEQRTGTRVSGQADSYESGRSDYHAPLLRLHGALHEQTSAFAKSSDTSFQSDVHAKENIVAVGFGHRAGAEPASDDAEGPGRPDYHPPLLRSHGALRDSTSLQFKSSDTSFGSDVHSKEHIVAVGFEHRDGVQPAGDGAEDAGRGEYHAPLVRSHGALYETAGQSKSSDMAGSDVSSKECIVAIRWG